MAVTADLYRAQWSGSGAAEFDRNPGPVYVYDPLGYPVETFYAHYPIQVGDELNVDYDVTLSSFTGDYSLAENVTGPPAVTGFDWGVRGQVGEYWRSMRTVNRTQTWSSGQDGSFLLYGVGGFAVIDLANFVGSTAFATRPYLNVAGCVGRGSDAEYDQFEITLNVFQSLGVGRGFLSGPFSPSPQIKFTFGYVRWSIKETTGDPAEPTFRNARQFGLSEADVTIDWVITRAALVF
jgi:hypothetical protein